VSPKTAADAETQTFGRAGASSAAARIAEVEPTIASIVELGSSHESGTKVGAARW
jgi:hypothetical protein